jgi:hypothetical protein
MRMGLRHSFTASPKALLLLACVCAFLSVFATFDTSEHCRAWRTARGWTEQQKTVAPAKDAEVLYALSLAALADITAVVVCSFACVLMLSVFVALESEPCLKAVKALAWMALGWGVVYSALIAAYRIEAWPRTVLKGPIFDYDVGLQPPIVVALAGFPLSAIVYVLYGLKPKRGQP